MKHKLLHKKGKKKISTAMLTIAPKKKRKIVIHFKVQSYSDPRKSLLNSFYKSVS